MNTLLSLLVVVCWLVGVACMSRYMYLYWTGRVSKLTTWPQLSQADLYTSVIGLACIALSLAVMIALTVLL